MPPHTQSNTQIQTRALHTVKHCTWPNRISERRTTTLGSCLVLWPGAVLQRDRRPLPSCEGQQPNSSLALMPQPVSDNRPQSRHSRRGLASTTVRPGAGKPGRAAKQTHIAAGLTGRGRPTDRRPCRAERMRCPGAGHGAGPARPKQDDGSRRLTAGSGRLKAEF